MTIQRVSHSTRQPGAEPDKHPAGRGGRRPVRSVLRARDIGPVAAIGMRSRPGRAVLSAAGVAIGIATIVSLFGISSSSRAQLIAQIDALGTNMLTVNPAPSFSSDQNPTLPATAPAMVRRIGPVIAASGIGEVHASIYRNDRIPAVNSEAITVYSADADLLRTLQGHMARGRFLSDATSRYPAVVLGTDAAAALGIDRADGSVRVWLANRWFGVIGILGRLPLAPELDRSALIGLPVARHLLHASGRPAQLYVRTSPSEVLAVARVLGRTVDPAAPQTVSITNPADALTARAAAKATFQGLLLGLGAVALLVGGIGIANVMVIAVLERRGEIGLRRALGATRRHIAVQFVAEAALLAGSGGTAGALLGGFATAVYSWARHWSAVVPAPFLLAAVGIALVIGAVAGVYPALRAARLAPAEALRLV
jgi:ABC-type lipoprotein release transport system permease subunit